MGVESAESFIAYARTLLERDAALDPKYRNFSPDGAKYFHQFMDGHSAEIQRLLDQYAKSGLSRKSMHAYRKDKHE